MPVWAELMTRRLPRPLKRRDRMTTADGRVRVGWTNTNYVPEAPGNIKEIVRLLSKAAPQILHAAFSGSIKIF